MGLTFNDIYTNFFSDKWIFCCFFNRKYLWGFFHYGHKKLGDISLYRKI